MTDTRRIAGGPPVPSLAMVSADQVTILGNGTPEYPLRAGQPVDASAFTAAFRGGASLPQRGQPVFVAFVSVPGGITTVQPAIAIEDFATSQVAGVIVAVNPDGTVQVKSSGLVELAPEDWDAVTGGTGGLQLGVTYFLDGVEFARLVPTPPPTPRVFVARIGIALNARTLLLALPSQMIRNLDGATVRARFNGQPPPLGIAVKVEAPGVVRGAFNIKDTEAAAIGVVVLVDGSDVVVQTAGIVTLTVAQWNRVTHSAVGLFPGQPYFLTGDFESGFYSTQRPFARGPVIAQIGVALTTTDFLLSTPPFSIAAGTV
jgi:hypothetical protein